MRFMAHAIEQEAERLCAILHQREALTRFIERANVNKRQIINRPVRRYNGCTAVHLAASKGLWECLEVLLKNGGDPNAVSSVTDLRQTPLHYAALNGRAKCLQILLAHGARDSQNAHHETALDMVRGKTMCEKILQQAAKLPVEAHNQPPAAIPLADPKELYANAMKTGRVKRKVIKCLIVGAAGVGKTSIKHLLLNKELPKKRVSTGVLENPDVAVSISRDVSISRGIMKGDSWYMVRNEKDLMNIIAEIMKARAKSEATDIVPNEKPQEKTLATCESGIVNSVEPMGTEESQVDSVDHKDFLSAIMKAEDSGGQPEFHDLLPVFVPNTSVVLFVFKLSEGLDEKPMVEYYDKDGKCIGDPNKSYLTHREILEHCLKVFHAQGETCQTILLIGTHKDYPEQKLKTDDLQECLKPFQKKVVLFPKNQPIALLNCLSKTNEDMNIVQEIREQLLRVVEDVKSEEVQDVESKETPMAWFGLELALKKASQSEASKHKGILSLEQCKLEADKFEYFRANSGQFDAAMQHFVKYNIFLHYSEVLPDVVFCDPQVLLTMVTQIVQYHYKLKHSQCAVKGEPQIMFRDNAYISAEILKYISSQYSDKKGVFSSDNFLKLLLHLKIITAIPKDVYLMPALLQNADDPAAMVGEIEGKERLPPLCISFNGGCAPCGVFCSVVATLLQLNNWKLCMNSDKPHCCFRNCVTFSYRVQTIITLVDFFSHFAIYMYIRKDSNLQKVSPVNIKNIVHESIVTVAKSLQYSILTFQDAIRCPSHPEENHVALWHLPSPSEEEEYYKCTVEDVCTGSIPGEYQVWMKNAVPTTQAPAPTPHPLPPHPHPPPPDAHPPPSSSCLAHLLPGAQPDQRPTLAELQCITVNGEVVSIIRNVADNWKNLCVVFNFDPNGRQLKIIEQRYPNQAEECCREMFQAWLKLSQVSWLTLITVLESCKEHLLAEYVKTYLGIGK